MSATRISVVGVACRYPDADSPEELWRTVLAGRRAFRRIPDERMRREDYYSPDPAAPDRFYTRKAAVIEGYEFDRVAFKVAGSTFRSTDMTHWLALETAAKALADAGFPAGEGLAGANTGVIIGNSLTGEFSRANLMRLRWPYVRRTVGAALREQGWDEPALAEFLGGLEQRYKAPFPAVDEDTLAGGLANTIAGSICNHFDFKGGGFTVDGACSSSLLSVATACNALSDGQLDVAVAGGVDLSIDPFEVIGFAKTGALATGEMRVYDKRSNGFWPGEGCGMLVLMREDDALAQRRFRHATIAGWGYSSDGKGSITRPEAGGHRLAIQRAYAAAGFGVESVSYFEGHGTGTAVGDATELRAFTEARHAADPHAPAAAISTVKGNFGHTKAAAGVGGLIKAILAVRHQVIPPATSHEDPHPALGGDRPALRVPSDAELWPAGAPVRAGVSSMGFGGINAHVVVERADGARRVSLGRTTERLVRSRQDTELLLLDATGIAELRGQVAHLAAMCGKLSYAELGDLAATLQAGLADRPIRAAVVAGAPEDAEARFTTLLSLLDNGARSVLDPIGGVYLGRRGQRPRIGLLFPGQGAGRRADGGALARRFAAVDELFRAHPVPPGADLVDTAVAQPRIAVGSVAGLRALSMLGIHGSGAVGHSLGELTALHWAGALGEAQVLDLAAARGRIMAEGGDGDGTMAGIAAPPEAVEPLLAGEDVVIAGYNGPGQTVVSGRREAVARVAARAAAAGLAAHVLAVSHAFHSRGVAPAAAALRERLAEEHFGPLAGRVFSTVTGAELPEDVDVAGLLTRQVLDPVRFSQAVTALAEESELLLEVGPGRILGGLAAQIAPEVPVVSLGTDGTSLAGLLHAVGAAYVLGAPVRHAALFEDRYTRPLPLNKEFRFFASPCESAPELDFAVEEGSSAPSAARVAPAAVGTDPAAETAPQPPADGGVEPAETSLQVLLRLAAQRAELPVEVVRPDTNPLDELHLSSITVGQIVNQAARDLGITAPMTASAFATSTLDELAAMLDELAGTAQAGDADRAGVAGVGPWVRAFSVDLIPTPVGPPVARASTDGAWKTFAPDGHPLAEALTYALRRAGLGHGVLLCLPRDCDESYTGLMLAAAREALAGPSGTRFVAVGDRRSAAGLAKTLHLESPGIATTVVTLPLPRDLPEPQAAQAAARIVADVAATAGFAEVCYDAQGGRRVPVLRALPESEPQDALDLLGPDDVLLVTGGGKGITAECALALGRDTGAAIGLIGRSDPARDAELAANLERMAAAGVRYHYTQADVTVFDDVKAAVTAVCEVFGDVTAVLHGAGRNEPRSLAALDEDAFGRTLAPKIDGLEAVLSAVDPERLRLLVSFSSIIGRAGLRGEADYATANDWLTDLTKRVQEQYPHCRCLSLEWSVWAGAGMGERLGVLESLTRDGVEPIAAEQGVALLQQLIADPRTPIAVVAMGRAEGLPTIALERPELPLLRFVERPRIFYPGVELVVDADLSAGGDLYLPDHDLDGDLLFPAVLGMEAMTQTAHALTGRAELPVLEDVEFLRPIVVPADGTTTIRVAVLATGADTVQAVIRSGETGFQADHFRARLRYRTPLPGGARPHPILADPPRLALRPADLYGSVLFQGGRFQRLLGYRQLAATSCVAEIAQRGDVSWFGGFLPGDLLAGDPGARDAFMHSIQCCVPDATLLPAGIERLHLADPAATSGQSSLVMHAAERLREGDTYVYDVDVRDASGTLVEHWQGLRLQAVRKQDGSGPWHPALLGAYLERRTGPALGRELCCVVWPDTPGEDSGGQAARRRHTGDALAWLMGPDTVVRHRPDGKPEVDGRAQVSAAHGAGVTFAVAGDHPVGCDIEVAAGRGEEDWAGLLGPDGLALARLLAAEHGEDLSLAATRVWGAIECLRKVGRTGGTGLAADGAGPGPERWVRLRAGAARIATFATHLRGIEEPVVFTLLSEGGA